MKHVVILFDERDMEVAERLDKSLAYMQRQGYLSTYSNLRVQPGENIQETLTEHIAKSEVTIIVLSIDLNQDLVFSMIDKHKQGETDLFVVYANYVDEELLHEFRRHQVPITPLLPVAEHKNKDFAYKKIVESVRSQLVTPPTKKPNSTKKKLLILLAAARKLPND